MNFHVTARALLRCFSESKCEVLHNTFPQNSVFLRMQTPEIFIIWKKNHSVMKVCSDMHLTANSIKYLPGEGKLVSSQLYLSSRARHYRSYKTHVNDKDRAERDQVRER